MATRRLLALALVLVLLASCGKDKAAPGVPDASPPAPSRASLGEVSDLPAETRVFLEARIAPLMGSPVVRQIFERVLGRDPEARTRLTSLLERCKVDLGRDVERVTLAMADPTDVALLVRGHLDEAALLECVRAEAGGLTSAPHPGGLTVYATQGEGSRVWLTFTQGLVVVSSSEKWLDAVLDEKGEKVASRPQMTALLGQVDRQASLWGAGTMPAGVGERLTELTRGAVKQPARAISFTVHAGAMLDARLRLEMVDEADARELATFMKGQIDLLALGAQRYGLGRTVARTQITTDGASVALALKLDENDVRLLEGALGQAPPAPQAPEPVRDEKEQGR